MSEFPVLETSRLRLRALALEDVADVQRLAGEWEVAAPTLSVPHPYEEGMAETWIAE
ncbi:MAG: GNAT family N-acetyltransferase [Gemmatimonadota bacterium]